MTQTNLPDIQCSEPKIKLPIQRVGVENVEVPFMLQLKNGGYHETIANVTMGTFLDQNIKGISMSRLVGTLKNYLNRPLNKKIIIEILKDMKKNVESSDAFIKFEFRIPINKKSPISDNIFPIFYKCKFEASLDKENTLTFFQGVRIQYASYCPCSAELSNHLEQSNLKGFPHAQRSYADVVIHVLETEFVWLEDLIKIIESSIATQPYPIIKRVDEQEIARIAAENPIFVEDAIRQISDALNKFRVYDWIVKCSHEESIHTSEAIAMAWKGQICGFDERYFI